MAKIGDMLYFFRDRGRGVIRDALLSAIMVKKVTEVCAILDKETTKNGWGEGNIIMQNIKKTDP